MNKLQLPALPTNSIFKSPISSPKLSYDTHFPDLSLVIQSTYGYVVALGCKQCKWSYSTSLTPPAPIHHFTYVSKSGCQI